MATLVVVLNYFYPFVRNRFSERLYGRKPRKKKDKDKNKRGRGTKKIPVMVLVERGGKAISKPIKRVDAANLKSAIRELVNRQAVIMTDEWTAYQGIGLEFDGGHGVVNHNLGQYVNGDISTHTAESYFALLKRGVHGVFHHISKQHLAGYCHEFSFRWNFRKVSDGERSEAAIKGAIGKRLTYRKAGM